MIFPVRKLNGPMNKFNRSHSANFLNFLLLFFDLIKIVLKTVLSISFDSFLISKFMLFSGKSSER